jgi:hypothetical protein
LWNGIKRQAVHLPYGRTAKSFIFLHILLSRLKKAMASIKTRQKIQSVIKTPSGLADFKDKEKIYYAEVDRGITLWEGKE